MSTLAGTVIADRYELGDMLGQGGQGTVFRARDRTTGRGVAVKMLTPGVAHNPEFAVRLAREQEALVALAGTSAVAVYDLCRSAGGSLCLVMELLEGMDLEKHLAELEGRSERMPKERLSAVFEPIVETLERAHDAGIVHRDVKPSNIFLLTEGGGVRLLDFGLSRMKTAAPLTAAGMVVGSPAYIAPEIWRGQAEEVDQHADAYSLAVILFRCLTGEVPFEAEALVDMLRLVTTAPRPSLRALRPDLPKAVDEWAERALAVDTAERFDGVRAMYVDLLRALEYTPPPRAPRPVADSLIGAWRTATSVFRRFIDATATGAVASPSDLPKAAPADAGRTDDSDEDGIRPTLIFKRPPPPSVVPETATIDDAWEEVTEAEIHSSAQSALADAARVASSTAAVDEVWEEVDADVDGPVTKRKSKPAPKAPSVKAKSKPAPRAKSAKASAPTATKPRAASPSKRVAASNKTKSSATRSTKRVPAKAPKKAAKASRPAGHKGATTKNQKPTRRDETSKRKKASAKKGRRSLG